MICREWSKTHEVYWLLYQRFLLLNTGRRPQHTELNQKLNINIFLQIGCSLTGFFYLLLLSRRIFFVKCKQMNGKNIPLRADRYQSRTQCRLSVLQWLRNIAVESVHEWSFFGVCQSFFETMKQFEQCSCNFLDEQLNLVSSGGEHLFAAI